MNCYKIFMRIQEMMKRYSFISHVDELKRESNTDEKSDYRKDAIDKFEDIDNGDANEVNKEQEATKLQESGVIPKMLKFKNLNELLDGRIFAEITEK